MDAARRVRLSKWLSLVLRHQPESIGVSLDGAGWIPVKDLLSALSAHGERVSRDDLAELVRTSDKQRFAFDETGERIRANQGHSVAIDLALPKATPPPRLFHGTPQRFLDAIRKEGLIKGERHHVHLSSDEATAKNVGQRRGAAVVLQVCAGDMANDGHVFYRSANGVWLTAHVPPRFIVFP